MASNQTIIAPTTGAVVHGETTAFETSIYPGVMLKADVLAGAEEVDIYVAANTTWVLAVVDGAVAKLTATAPSIVLPGGPRYAVAKDATAGACGVYIDHLTRGH